MKDNVTQLINFEGENLEKIKNDFINDPSNFSDFEKNTNDFFENVKKNFMQNMLNALDKNICESPQRKKEGYINTSDQKDYYTTSGTLTFTKTLFTNKKTKESRYLIDDILGIEPHERISDNAKAMILDEAVQTSYKRAGEVISKVDSVSKETVKNLVHSIEFPKETYENIKSKKVVPVLYIEADEDHAKLQFHNKKGDLVKGKNGRKDNGLTSKLVYVHEGTKFESSNSKRRVVINPHYFASTCTDTDNEEFWREVDAYIQAVYNTEQIPFIFLMADGGNGIKTALKYIPNLIYVLDEFHLNKYINRIANNFGDSADDVRKALRKIIEKNDYATFDNTIAQLVKTLNSTNKEKVLNDAKYILNNGDACKRRLLLKNRICGCSAEGHVSHVLSARMSSRPMGWSIKGGSKIVELIAYKGNDKDIKNLITFQKFLKHKDDMEYEKKIQKHKKYYIADKLKANTILTSKETKQKYAEVFSAKTGPAAYHRNGLEKDAV